MPFFLSPSFCFSSFTLSHLPGTIASLHFVGASGDARPPQPAAGSRHGSWIPPRLADQARVESEQPGAFTRHDCILERLAIEPTGQVFVEQQCKGSRYLQRGRLSMGVADKARDKAEVAKGHVKEGAGKAAGDPVLETEGKGDKISGDLKQAGEKVKDAFKR
jgi:uncharacterized protein YjbJ (UPF0337 family)